MVRPPITLADRLQQAGSLLIMAGIVLSIGLALLRAIGRSSAARRRPAKPASRGPSPIPSCG